MKMPPPGKLPPNGNDSSRMNGRAEEPSFAERLARVEAMVQSAATKKEFAEIKGEIELLGERTESIRRELRADIGLVNERIESVKRELNQKIESVRTELKAEMVTLNQKIDSTKTELKAEMVTLNEKVTQMQGNMATKADIQEVVTKSANRILRWMVGSMISIVALVAALVRFL